MVGQIVPSQQNARNLVKGLVFASLVLSLYWIGIVSGVSLLSDGGMKLAETFRAVWPTLAGLMLSTTALLSRDRTGRLSVALAALGFVFATLRPFGLLGA